MNEKNGALKACGLLQKVIFLEKSRNSLKYVPKSNDYVEIVV